jgi:hypothetical protein
VGSSRRHSGTDTWRISACVADDWVLITPEMGVVPGSRILHVIESGELSHDTMTKDGGRVRVYGDVAVVTARGRNNGSLQRAANQCRRVGDRRVPEGRRTVALRPYAFDTGCCTIGRSIHLGESALRLLVTAIVSIWRGPITTPMSHNQRLRLWKFDTAKWRDL